MTRAFHAFLLLSFVAMHVVRAVLAQVPAQPQNLSVSLTASGDYPIGSTIEIAVTNGVASWYSPPYIPRTNSSAFVQPIATIWLPEFSADGVTWTAFGTELAYLPTRGVRALNQPCFTCLHLVEVNGTDRARIRLVSY